MKITKPLDLALKQIASQLWAGSSSARLPLLSIACDNARLDGHDQSDLQAQRQSMDYYQLTESNELPGIGKPVPFKVVLAVEDRVSLARQDEISNWLVESGGRYAMVCGDGCESWKKTIRQANLALVNIDDMTPEQFVMITTHAHERLRNVFWHAKKHAHHSHHKIDRIVTIHIGRQNRSVEYLTLFDKA